MQERREEHNRGTPWGVSLGVSMLLVLVAAAAVEVPLLASGPLPEDCLRGAGEFWGLRALAAGAAVGAGWTAAILCLFRPLARRSGFYGQLVASLLAALVMTAVPEPLRRPGEALGFPGWVAVGLVAALLSPKFRERGMLSLIWPPLILGLLLVHGRRETLHAAKRSLPLRAIQAAVDVAGAAPFLSVPSRLPMDERRALVLGLRRPFFDRDVDLVMVDRGSPEERWLGVLGGTALRLDGGDLAIVHGAGRPPLSTPLTVQAFPGPDGAWGFSVFPAGNHVLRIVTPTGVLRHRLDGGSAVGGLEPLERRALSRLLAPPLPPGLPVLIVVEAVDNSDFFGWFWSKSP